jgi:hypothetical protein
MFSLPVSCAASTPSFTDVETLSRQVGGQLLIGLAGKRELIERIAPRKGVNGRILAGNGKSRTIFRSIKRFAGKG